MIPVPFFRLQGRKEKEDELNESSFDIYFVQKDRWNVKIRFFYRKQELHKELDDNNKFLLSSDGPVHLHCVRHLQYELPTCCSLERTNIGLTYTFLCASSFTTLVPH